jgi:hypothetical protein
MKEINVVEFDAPILMGSTKLFVYQFNQKLLRLFNDNIVVHPHIMLYSTTLLISPTPFAFKQGNTIKLHSILAPRKVFELSQRLEEVSMVLPFTDNSIAIYSPLSTSAKIILVNSSEEFEHHDLEFVKYIVPQGLFSYIVDTENRLSIAKDFSDVEFLAKCHDVRYAELEGVKLLTCHVGNSKTVVLSDGLYGHVHEFQDNDFGSVINVTMLHNTIALHTDAGTILISFDNGKDLLYRTSYRIESPMHLYDGIFIGRIANHLALYDADKNRLKILSIQASNHVKVYPQEGIIAVMRKDGVTLLGIDYEKFVEIKKTVQGIALVNSKLLLLTNGKLAVYELSKTSESLIAEELYEEPTTLVNCSEASDREIICTDILGRIIIAHGDRILKATPRIHKLRNSSHISVLLSSYTPGYPLKIVPCECSHIAFQRYNAITSEIIAETKQSPNFHLNLMLHGIIGREEKVIGLQQTAKTRNSRNHIIQRLVLLNNYPLTCNREVEHSLKECLKTLLLASELHSSAICVANEMMFNKDNELDTMEYLLVAVEEIEKVDMHPLVDWKRRTVCFYPPTLQDVDLRLEVFCGSHILTLESGCMKLDKECNYLAMAITARIRNEKCEQRIMLRCNTVAELRRGETSAALFEQDIVYKLVLPNTCIAISYAKIVYRDYLQLHVAMKNQCTNVVPTILAHGYSDIIAPNSEKAFVIPINLDDIIRGGRAIGIAEPTKVSVLMFPINLSQLLQSAHQIALKISATIGLRR